MGELTKYAYLPYILICGIMNVAAMRPVASMDSVKGKETCFSMAWPNLFGFLSALWVRISCMQSYKKKWAGHKKVQTQGSLYQLPNVITFIVLIVGLVYSLTSFFTEGFHNPWEYFPQICIGMYMASSLFPVVRVTIQEYFGWAPSHCKTEAACRPQLCLRPWLLGRVCGRLCTSEIKA